MTNFSSNLRASDETRLFIHSCAGIFSIPISLIMRSTKHNRTKRKHIHFFIMKINISKVGIQSAVAITRNKQIRHLQNY